MRSEGEGRFPRPHWFSWPVIWGIMVSMTGARPQRRWLRMLMLAAVSTLVAVVVSVIGVNLWVSSKLVPLGVTATGSGPGGVWLLVGLDDRSAAEGEIRGDVGGGEPGARADIVLLVTKSRDTLRVLSIDRGLLLVDGKGTPGRLGASWLEGPQRTLNLLCHGLSVGVDHVAAVDFRGLVGVVDALGGVDVDLPHPLRDEPAHLDVPGGAQRVDGRTALALVRSRQGQQRIDGRWRPEPDGAFGRQRRAGMVLQGLLTRTQQSGPVGMAAAVGALEAVYVDDATRPLDVRSLLGTRSVQIDQLAVTHDPVSDLYADLAPRAKVQLKEAGLTGCRHEA